MILTSFETALRSRGICFACAKLINEDEVVRLSEIPLAERLKVMQVSECVQDNDGGEEPRSLVFLDLKDSSDADLRPEDFMRNKERKSV